MSLITALAGSMNLTTEVRATPPASAEMVLVGVLGTTLDAAQPTYVTLINTGLEGRPGNPGPSGAGINWPQVAPAATWTIAHNLGYRPSVQTFNTGGAEILGAILHLSVNVVQISFLQPVAGTARVN